MFLAINAFHSKGSPSNPTNDNNTKQFSILKGRKKSRKTNGELTKVVILMIIESTWFKLLLLD